jgi:hypothetical protein
MELEGLSPEDQEFELARHFVHLIDAVHAELAQERRRGACRARAEGAGGRPCCARRAPRRRAC